LKGLEASIIPYSALENLQTIGAEYYDRTYVEDQNRLRSGRYQLATLGTLCTLITDGDHGVADYQDAGVPFILSENVKEGYVDINKVRYISNEHHNYLAKSKLKDGDVIVTKTGVYFGKSAVFDSQIGEANTIAHVGILRLREKTDPYFVSTFLNSRYGQSQLRRRGIKATRPEIKLVEFYDIEVICVSPNLTRAIRETIKRSMEIRRETEKAVDEASITLLSALGLADWSPPESLTYTASATFAFAAGRLDAQYFMPAKEQVHQSLAALPGQVLADRVDSIRDQWLPERAPPETLVRNFDVTDALVPLLDTEKEPSAAQDIGSMKKVLKDGDLAISRLRAYLKEIAVVRTGDDLPSVGSSEFIVLRPRGNSISPEALMVLLRSPPVQTILKFCQDGSQHPRFSEKDLLAIPVPDAVVRASPEITAIVLRGFAARRRAAALLEAAKRAVEIAVEQDEAAALQLLDAVEA
jgi:type I restriction enzyme S subunit